MSLDSEAIYITSRQLRQRFGGVSHMWIERRLADPDPSIPFPKPIYIKNRRYWRLDEIEAWERAAAARYCKVSAKVAL